MISLDHITVRAGSFSLHDICLEIQSGEYGVLMGRTGSGKTTIVECLCGLRSVEKGRVRLAGRDVTTQRPAERSVGYVPQDGALFPRMTVRRNLDFPLIVRKWSRADIRSRTEHLAELLSIGHLLDRTTDGLSGGEAQRVALGRALAFEPATLILDEPLSALDEQTREQMQRLLRSVPAETGVTVLHVTHNRDDARRLADRLFVLRDGKMVGIAKSGGGGFEFPELSHTAC